MDCTQLAEIFAGDRAEDLDDATSKAFDEHLNGCQACLDRLADAENELAPLTDWEPPPIIGVTAAGDKVSLAGLKGRVVLINFWASWCAPCRAEMSDFERLHKEFATKGLTVLAVNIREAPEVIRRFGRILGLTFPLVLDPKGRISRAYGVVGLPSTFLIARDGRPFALAVGEREWANADGRALVRVLLAEPPYGKR